MPSKVISTTVPKLADSEKITINVGFVDLGHIDLLVAEGFYSNRTDLIRTAIRNQLSTHAEVLRQAVLRKTLVLGLQSFSAADLEAVRTAGERLQIRVLGLAVIAPDVSPELALATIDSITVLGAFHAPAAVKSALSARVR
ncbi:CopG family transcriptional regulator [Variovorax sp. tm]|jgi:Arc/MetJ-type ribon-helix-helix transcriptional regulator|uniref:CopG family transcriptional regulator n=1 Tax=Variovorax atrisoli TaxID=3394203 RepID=UPI00278B338C|nr:Arc/MetJ-type ribon-helix-helix transcriptional regulator [Variovorax paradoxus]